MAPGPNFQTGSGFGVTQNRFGRVRTCLNSPTIFAVSFVSLVCLHPSVQACPPAPARLLNIGMIFQSFITISITKHLNLVFVCACLRTLPHIFCILAHVRSCASRLYLSASVVCKHDLFANICVCSHLVANLGELSKYCFSYVTHLSVLVLARVCMLPHV